MKLVLLAFAVALNIPVLLGQIDYNVTIIGRNNGTHTFDDGIQTRIFGFTSSLGAATKIPGPVIDIVSGDSVQLKFINMSQGAPHTIHLHGLDVDQQNDGVGMLSFEVLHDSTGYYYFKVPHPGTYLYHCHVGSTVHLQAGMYGLCIVRPSDGSHTLNWDNGESYAREFALLTSEIDTVWHNDTILDHEHMEGMPLYVPDHFSPQYFLVNGKNGAQLTDPLNHLFALANEKVYMRLANIGYYGVRFIFPAVLSARTVSSDGRPLPAEVLSDTVEILPGERYETFLQLGSDQFYPFTVEHFNLNTQLVASSQQMVIQISSAGMDELVSDILVFPNPSEGYFLIQGEIQGQYTIEDMEGRVIHIGSEQVIDLSGNASGIYFLRYGNSLYKLMKL